MPSRRTYPLIRRVHLWLSLICALPLVVLSLTGTLLVFGPELQRLTAPARWYVEPGDAPLPMQDLVDRLAVARPDLRPWSVTVDPDPSHAWRVWLAGGAGILNVDPSSGRILDHYDQYETVYGVVLGLHRWWMTPGGPARAWARDALAAISLLMMIQVVVGLSLWALPSKRLQRLRPDFSRSPRLIVLRLHQLAGVVTALLLLMVAFTGLSMRWNDGTKPIVETLFLGSIDRMTDPETADLAPLPDLDEAIALARQRFPQGRLLHVRVPSRPGAMAVVGLDVPGSYSNARVWAGDSPPRIVAVEDPAVASTASHVWHMRYVLHVGDFGGLPVRLLWLLVAMMPAAFTITGLWLWLHRRRPRRRQDDLATQTG